MKTEPSARLNRLYFIFLLFFCLLALRIVYLQLFRQRFLRGLSQNQYYRLVPLQGRRGKILDCQGRSLATSLNYYSVFADPSLVDDVASTAQLLAPKLKMDQEALRLKLGKDSRFVWLRRKVSLEDKEAIDSLGLAGVGFIKESRRFYPQERLAATSLGIVDIDNNGLEGLEFFYESYLRGKQGWARVLQDSSLRKLTLSPEIIVPQSGGDLILTIDAQIQYWVQTYLEETITDFRAAAGSVAVMNAAGGQILALANYPGFNPNQRNESPAASRRNVAVCDMFEPGSVFKMITLLAASDLAAFDDEDILFCEEGKFKIPGTWLHDWKPYGDLTFREVFKKSSNIGVGKIATSLGPDIIYHYIKKLGFGQASGIDFPGESPGSLKPLGQWSKTSAYIIPIGQEVGVNLIQLVRAFAVVVNGGYLVQPHLVKGIVFMASTKEISLKRERVVPLAAVERAKGILIEVVEEGTGKLARVEGVTIGGKTGTAQKYDIQLGRYSPRDYRASFVGFLDTTPPLVIGVTIDEPRKHHFGGVVAAPLFGKIAEKVASYLERKRSLVQSR